MLLPPRTPAPITGLLSVLETLPLDDLQRAFWAGLDPSGMSALRLTCTALGWLCLGDKHHVNLSPTASTGWITAFPEATSLTLGGWSAEHVQRAQELLAGASSLSTLTSLTLSSGNDPDHSSWHIDAALTALASSLCSSLPHLTKLELQHFFQLPKSFFRALEPLKGLVNLQLDCVGFNDQACSMNPLKAIAQLTRLTCLYVGDLCLTRVYGRDLAVLSSLTALKELDIFNQKTSPGGFWQQVSFVSALTCLTSLRLEDWDERRPQRLVSGGWDSHWGYQGYSDAEDEQGADVAEEEEEGWEQDWENGGGAVEEGAGEGDGGGGAEAAAATAVQSVAVVPAVEFDREVNNTLATLTTLTRLRCLSLSCKLRDQGLPALASMQQLSELQLMGVQLQRTRESRVGLPASLRSLKLSTTSAVCLARLLPLPEGCQVEFNDEFDCGLSVADASPATLTALRAIGDAVRSSRLSLAHGSRWRFLTEAGPGSSSNDAATAVPEPQLPASGMLVALKASLAGAQELQLDGLCFDAAAAAAVPSTLSSLSLDDCRVDDGALPALAAASRHLHLSLSGCTGPGATAEQLLAFARASSRHAAVRIWGGKGALQKDAVPALFSAEGLAPKLTFGGCW